MDSINKPTLTQKNNSVKIECYSGSLPPPSTIEEVISLTIAESEKPVKEIAKDLKVSYSLLANASNLNLPLKFSSRHLLPLMLSTQNFSIFKFLGRQCGFGFFKIPQKSNSGSLLIASGKLQDSITKLGKVVHSFFCQHCDRKFLNEITLLSQDLIEATGEFKAVAEELKNSDKKKNKN